jgi:GAF domain/Pyridoxamine 5'-phosphate oxidase
VALNRAEPAIPLERLARCFQAIIPSMLATAARDGVPNIVPVSYAHVVDAHHVALSRQFFRKTQANLLENPTALLIVQDPVTRETYRLGIRFAHEETSGALFDLMSARIDAVAAVSGMSHVFRLQAACVFEVLSVERIPGVLVPSATEGAADRAGDPHDAMAHLRALQSISGCLRSTEDAERLLDEMLVMLDRTLGFAHSMLLLVDETGERLYAIASHGYPESGIGATLQFGDGIIGTVARTRRPVRVSSMSRDIAYGRAVRSSSGSPRADEVPLPGLPDRESQLAVPLLVKDELLGVLAVESRDPLAFTDRDETFLDVMAGHVALALRELLRRPDDPAGAAPPGSRSAPKSTGPTHRFHYYPADDCVFLDGQYLIRNVPGRILWKLLQAHAREGRSRFTNRELRLDPSLGLPPLRDNLESRLILLRKRLADKCPDLGVVSLGRGQFALEVRCVIELTVQGA